VTFAFLQATKVSMKKRGLMRQPFRKSQFVSNKIKTGKVWNFSSNDGIIFEKGCHIKFDVDARVFYP